MILIVSLCIHSLQITSIFFFSLQSFDISWMNSAVLFSVHVCIPILFPRIDSSAPTFIVIDTSNQGGKIYVFMVPHAC
jgi:hypothetical protein